MPNTPCMFIRCNVAISVARLEVNPASASCKCSSKFWGHPQKELKTCFGFFLPRTFWLQELGFTMLPKKDPRKLVTDLRPAASIRFFAITGKSLAGTARMWSAMYNRRPRLSRSTLDVAMPGSIKHRPRYFDATVSFNTLLRCRASTIFIHSFIRLVYGDTWAGKANGVINLAAENKMHELSSAT